MSAAPLCAPPIVLIGHPFAPSGMGELIRSTVSSLRAAGVPFRVLDCHGYFPEIKHLQVEQTRQLGSVINVFHINGDEVCAILDALGPFPAGSRNIIFPAWELSSYPAEWARELDRFDEVWAFSTFVAESYRHATRRPVVQVPLAIRPALRLYHSRHRWGLPASAVVFFFSFDCASYPARKNPWAAIAAFKALAAQRPQVDVRLVLKVSGGDRAPETVERLRLEMSDLGTRGVLIERTLEEDEMRSLLLGCDIYLSLHRAEGFGFCLAEAMYYGKPVIATAYSGNIDFMSDSTACLVDYTMVPVGVDEYPHAHGQRWAKPDLESAVQHMIRLVDYPDERRSIGSKAQAWMRVNGSPLAAGLVYRDLLLKQAP